MARRTSATSFKLLSPYRGTQQIEDRQQNRAEISDNEKSLLLPGIEFRPSKLLSTLAVTYLSRYFKTSVSLKTDKVAGSAKPGQASIMATVRLIYEGLWPAREMTHHNSGAVEGGRRDFGYTSSGMTKSELSVRKYNRYYMQTVELLPLTDTKGRSVEWETAVTVKEHTHGTLIVLNVT